VKRLIIGFVTTIVAFALATGGVIGAWAFGVNVPGMQGATYLKAVKIEARGVGGVRTDGPTFVMLVGSDSRPGVGGSRGDALHLLAINPAKHAGTIINFPRDTCTAVPGRGTVRINEANSQGGPGLTAQVISQITGAPITYAATVDFAGFLGLVNGAGGFDIQIPFPMHDSYSNANFDPGPRHLDGVLALAFARDRHSFPDSDIQRSFNQGYLMIAAIRSLEHNYRTTSGRMQLAALMLRHAQLSGLGLSDLMRLGELAQSVPASGYKTVTIPTTGSTCLGIAPAAQALFADVRDDGVLESYPAGTPALPNPQP
jgi:LCP family protein required for cell wall assembly